MDPMCNVIALLCLYPVTSTCYFAPCHRLQAAATTLTTIKTNTVRLKMYNKQEKNPTKDDWHVRWQIITRRVKRTTNQLYEERRDFLYVTQTLPVNTGGPTLCVTHRPSIKIEKKSDSYHLFLRVYNQFNLLIMSGSLWLSGLSVSRQWLVCNISFFTHVS